MMKTYLLGSATAAALLLAGCSSSDDTTTTITDSSTVAQSQTGYFVDAAVENLDYDCVTDNTNGKTDAKGAFTCQHMDQVRFRIGD